MFPNPEGLRSNASEKKQQDVRAGRKEEELACDEARFKKKGNKKNKKMKKEAGLFSSPTLEGCETRLLKEGEGSNSKVGTTKLC